MEKAGRVTRRAFLGTCAASIPTVGCAVETRETSSPSSPSQSAELCRCTYTYKKVGDLQIKLDVHWVDDGVTRPVLVWLHGGALMMGYRATIDGRVSKAVLKAGYTIVSIDYRLTPETKIPDLIQDVEDAFQWVYSEGPDLFNADVSRLAVAGASAGGYLTLTAGFRIKPRPAALVSIYGYGDLIGDWYSRPSPHPRHQRIVMSREEAFQQVSEPPIADVRDRKGNGGAFYVHCRQQGIWPYEISGWDPHTEAEKFYPYMAVKNVTPDYPPTLLLHGTDDTDVPYQQSVMMAEELEKHGVEHSLISLEGGEHGFGGADPEAIAAAYAEIVPFLDRYVKV